MKPFKRSALKSLVLLGTLVTFLSSCGGLDTPFSLVDNNSDNSGSGPGGGNPVGGNPTGQGCAVQFSSQLVLKTKVAPGASSSADPTGLITSDPKDLPPITLHFNGSEVSMNGDEFQPTQIQLGTQQVTVRQKAGTQASGSYNAEEGSISLSNVEFEITSPLTIPLPPFTFTTETANANGNFGNLSEQGERLNSSTKALKMVGGFQITSFPLSEFVGAAVTVSFDGEFDSVPDPATCTGGSGSSGLVLKEVIVNGDGTSSEVNLGANNTLDFGRVFVPQAGVDSPFPSDTRFSKTKTLRVRNQTLSAVSGTINSPSGFTIAPNGGVNIAPGGSQEFQIRFGFAPVSDYSETNVPASRSVTGTMSLGSANITLAGEAKRAAPELTLAGTESNAPSTVDLGVSPAPVLGSGASTRLNCLGGTDHPIPVLARKVSLQNTGVRPLQIQKIRAPQNATPQTPDPFCAGYGSEFLRMGLNVEGGASCNTVTIGGHTYLTDQCQIPVGNGKVNLKVVYYPMNASSIREATGNTVAKDTGSMTIESNDPRFDGSAGHDFFLLNLQGGVSPDRSDVLKIKREGSNTEISAGGNVRVNIPNSTDANITQKLIFRNYLDQPLTNVQMTVADTARFQILSTPTPPPTTIPAMGPGAGAEPGHAEFYVRFTKPAGATSGNFPTTLTVRFIPDNTGVENTFRVNLIGSVNYQMPMGEAQMTIEFISSYIDTPLLGTSPVDSLDYRKPQVAAFRPGPLRMNFTPVAGSENLRSVTITNVPGLEPTHPNVLNNLRSAPKAQRLKLVRVYSTRLSGYPGGVEDANHDGVPDCADPDNINQDHVPSTCSFFYYLFAAKPGRPGVYNDETGELIFPDIDLRVINPYHATVLDYLSTLMTNTALRATVSTLTIDSKFAGETPMVPEPGISNSEIAVPDSVADSVFASPTYRCPGGESWRPTDAATPAFGCYIESSSPHYLKGMQLTPLPNGDYSMILTLLTRFKAPGPPDNVPSFMANGEIWVAIQGRLHDCSDGACLP